MPVVLTVAKPSRREAAWDYELLREIADLRIEVIRTKWKDILWLPDVLDKLALYRFSGWCSTFCRRFPPDSYVGWYPYAVMAGIKAIRQRGIDCIYSNSAPFTSHLIARRLKKRTGLPWIADFRDPWVDDPLRPESLFKWQETLEELQEAQVVTTADHVITASKNFASFLRRKYPISKRRITTIHNGYDWAAGQGHQQRNQNDCLEIVYAGAFYGPQSPETFLESLDSLLRKRKIPKKKIKFTIIGGHGDKSWQGRFAGRPVLKNVSITSFIPNDQVREKLIKASCLLIHQARERGDLIVLGKTFEYISTGRPILVLVNDKTECFEVLDKSGCVFKQAEPDSINEVRDAILHIYRSWENGKLRVEANWKYISLFEGKNLTKRFVQVLNRVA